MILLDGKKLASEREVFLKLRAEKFHLRHGKKPCLAVVLIGEDPASHIYVKNKELACHRVGLGSVRFNLPASTQAAEVYSLISRLNADPTIHGILVQLPVPKQVPLSELLSRISPLKDVDGLTFENMGLLWSGSKRVAPCTPSGVIEILRHYGVALAGLRAAVIGRSNIVGKPMAQLLLNADATVTVVHSKTSNPRGILREADIVVVAAGKARAFGRDDFKKGAVVVDVGIHRVDGKVCGDVRFEELDGHLAAATPVPGGVGPMTINLLIENTLELAEQQATKELL